MPHLPGFVSVRFSVPNLILISLAVQSHTSKGSALQKESLNTDFTRSGFYSKHVSGSYDICFHNFRSMYLQGVMRLFQTPERKTQ